MKQKERKQSITKACSLIDRHVGRQIFDAITNKLLNYGCFHTVPLDVSCVHDGKTKPKEDPKDPSKCIYMFYLMNKMQGQCPAAGTDKVLNCLNVCNSVVHMFLASF